MTITELEALLEYIEKHHSRKNMFENHMSLPKGKQLQKIVTYVDFGVDTRDGAIWKVTFSGIIWSNSKNNNKDEVTFRTECDYDLKDKIYSWLKEA